jgi:hypothetical protein
MHLRRDTIGVEESAICIGRTQSSKAVAMFVLVPAVTYAAQAK